MRIEYRISNVDEIKDFMEYIVIGNEGCVYSFLSGKNNEIVKKAVEHTLNIRVLTPLIPDGYIDKVYNRIMQWTQYNQNMKITFNDFGLLYKCASLISEHKITPVCGRIISRSIIDCPWYKELLQDEKEEIKSAILNYNFLHNSKIEFIKCFGMSEIELNYHAIYKEALLYLDQQNIKLTTHNNVLLSVGRVCFSARWHEKPYPDCINEDICSKILKIRRGEAWVNWNESRNNSNAPLFQELCVRGNLVYYENETDDYENIASLILG